MNDLIQVITTCTSRKLGPSVSLAGESLPGVEATAEFSLPAERLYAGEQHRRLMAGVDALRLRHQVNVWIVSAKAGLVAGDERIASYDDTFARLRSDELRRRADGLGIAHAFRGVAARDCGLTLVLAGNEYFDAARLSEPVEWSSPTIALVSPSRAIEMPAHRRLLVVGVSQADAKRWSLPLTLLKGEIARQILSALAADPGDASAGDRARAHVTRLRRTDPELLTCP